MAYVRQEVTDHKTVMNKFLYDNLQDGIDESLQTIRETNETVKDAKEYIDQQIVTITKTGIPKLLVYPLVVIATKEGQTVFPIDLDSFDVNTDTVFVQSGRTMLSPNLDFNIIDNAIVLKEGVPLDRNIDIYVFKNIPIGDEGSVTGAVIAPNTLPLNRLIGLTPENIGAFPMKIIPNADYNTLTTNGYFEVQGNCPNNPHGTNDTHFHVLCFHHSFEGWNKQLALDVRSDAIFFRTQQNGVWSDWNSVLFVDKNGKLKRNVIISNNGDAGETLLVDGDNYGMLQKRFGNNVAQFIASAGDNKAWFNTSTDGGATFAQNQLFGQHNKPKKTYTGNGSATERVINTGGISDCFVIYSMYGVVLVTPLGSFYGYQGTFGHLMPNIVTSSSGYIWITSTLEVLNQNGVEYTYYSL